MNPGRCGFSTWATTGRSWAQLAAHAPRPDAPLLTEAAAEVYGADGGAAVTRTIPMERMAVPADIANSCLFLASPLSSYVNGADIAVHGGGEYPARYMATHQD